MICGKGMSSYKTVKSCTALSHKEERKGAKAYTKMPKSTSVDWLIASRKVEPVELHNSTVSEENKIIKEVKKWLRH